MADTKDEPTETSEKHRDVQPGGGSSRGPEPDPGGQEEPGGLVPPYDGRSTGSDELKGTVERQYGDAEGGGAGQTASPAEESPVGEHEVTHETPDSPHGVGESTARRGEDMAEADGKEAGRTDTGTEHKSERPTGTSDARDATGVDPQDSR